MVEYTVLGSGSSGNCSAIRCDDKVLLVDAGFSAKELARRLEVASIPQDQVIGILVSHEHSDHVSAIRVFCKRYKSVPVFANGLTAERLQHIKKAPEDPDLFVIFNNGSPFQVGPFTVDPFSISHDAIDPVGFKIDVAGRKIGIATDLGHAGKMVPLKLRDCHILLLEANHCPKLLRNSKRPVQLQHRILGRRGHLSNEHGADLVSKTAGPSTKFLFVGHVSDECNDHDLIRSHISESLAGIDRADLEFAIALQHEVSRTIVV
jgi:phosphoribosyl 1,2-cyclic phosphodiesterase